MYARSAGLLNFTKFDFTYAVAEENMKFSLNWTVTKELELA